MTREKKREIITKAVKQKYGPTTEITSLQDDGEMFIVDDGIVRHLFVVCSEVPRGVVVQIFAQTHQVLVPK